MRSLPCLFAVILAACGTDRTAGDDTPAPDADVTPPGPTDPLHGLPTGVAQWTALCAKGYGDAISLAFCAGTAPPPLTSLKDLEALLGLTMVPNPNFDPALNQNVRITLTGLSTGIGLRTTTPLNPRAFLMTPPLGTGVPNPSYTVIAFSRGEPLVELVANDPSANTLRFFLVRFHPACEATSCSYADLLTPAIESGWTDYTLYDDATIANTTLDCLACHQTAGPGTKKILRMQELANPWAHWFYVELAANQRAMQDFHAGHGSEDYAGIPMVNIDPSRPISLQRLVSNNGFATQPNAFDTTTIQNELTATGASATWQKLYARAVAGQEIPPPYYGIPQTDPAKVTAAIQAYKATMAGTLPSGQMPDIRDTLLDSALADMSIRPAAGLDGNGILVHMCQMCHNSRLDQTLTRARFNIETLAALSRAEKDEAIARLNLPESDALHMPPARFHVLSDAERALAIQALAQ